ncbi:unnamed protein product, partial [Brenthis ino]
MCSNKIEKIKREIATELQIRALEIQSRNNVDSNLSPEVQENVENQIQVQPNIIKRNEDIDKIFKACLEYYINIDPVKRNFIPRQRSSKRLAEIVDYINKIILPENLDSTISFKSFQTVLYCAAWTAAKANGAKIENKPKDNMSKI